MIIEKRTRDGRTAIVKARLRGRSFLQAHWGQFAGMDFFTAEVWTPRGLVTYYVLFVSDLKARKVEIAGITPFPDMLLRWHRRLIAAKWAFPAKKRVGRPGLMKTIKALIVHMALSNPSWGYARIKGELKGVGHDVARSTIAKVLRENGIKPAPDRPSSGRSFLQAHWGQIAGMDFFTAEVWTPRGLVTYYVLFVIDLKTRRRVKWSNDLRAAFPRPQGRF